MKYTLTKSGMVIREDGACIPPDEYNTDYRDFLQWQADGGVPDIMPEPPAPTDSQIAQQALDDLERTTMMSRGMREYLMVSMQDLAQRQSDQMAEQGITMSAADVLNTQPAWTKLVAINEQAIALRKRIVS